MSFRMSHRRRRQPLKRGAALLMTLFTVAALLALGTTFIGISIGESRQSAAEMYSGVAKQLGSLGVNWAASYMCDPRHWSNTGTNFQTGYIGYDLTNKVNGDTTTQYINNPLWMGKAYRYTKTATTPNNVWSFTVGADNTNVPTAATAFVIASPDQNTQGFSFWGVVDIRITETLSTANQPPQYVVVATSRVYKAQDPGNVMATRTITARLRAETVADYSVFESNMRTWDAPGKNKEYAPPQTNTNDYNMYTSIRSMLVDEVGIPTNYTMSGDFRADGSADPNDQFAQYSGNVNIFAHNQTQLNTVRFQGSTSIATGKNNAYDTALNRNDTNSGIFTKGLEHKDPQQLPKTSKFLDVRDPSGAMVVVDASRPSGGGIWSAKAANENGYFKVESDTADDFVNLATNPSGAGNIEFSSSSPGQPGVAKMVITFNGNGGATVTKIGAYSGRQVGGTTTYTAASLPSVLYIDGGNVEVQGNAPKGVTVVAAASTDRPTTAVNTATNPPTTGLMNYGNTAVMNTLRQKTIYAPVDPEGPTRVVDQAGNVTLIMPPDRGLQATFGASARWPRDAEGKITGPYMDTSCSPPRPYWPAFDPATVGVAGGDITSNAPVVREGNLSVVGDVGKTNPSSGVGLVAQNYIFLSDQRAASTTLNVNAVLMSLEHSVQYGGFLSNPASNTGMADYWKNMGGRGAGATLRRPANLAQLQNNAGTFNLQGSVIGKFADVESGKTGTNPDAPVYVGYNSQSFQTDPNLKNNLPPSFPQFDRTQTAPVAFVILAWSDGSSLRER